MDSFNDGATVDSIGSGWDNMETSSTSQSESRNENGTESREGELPFLNIEHKETSPILATEHAEFYNGQARLLAGSVKDRSRKYIADVFLPRDSGDIFEILRLLSDAIGGRKNGFIGYSSDGDHLHIIHDCSYSNRTCRCRFKERLEPFGIFKKHGRFIKSIAELEHRDWYNIVVYYFLSKRGIKQLRIDGEISRFPLDSELLQDRESNARWSQEFRQEQALWGQSNDYTTQFRNKRSLGEVDGVDTERFHGKKSKRTSQWDTVRSEITKLLSNFHIAPLQTIRTMEEFQKQPILTNPKNDAYVTRAIELYSNSLNKLSIREFEEMLTAEDKNPIFYKGMQYGTLEESIEIIDDLLKYQFDDDNEKIVEFLQSLVDVFDKRIPKLNCICIKSPPSGGKNFFFDMWCAIFINYGQLGRANRHNQFAFQEAPNKRMLLWNEPNYESTLTDTIKMMMAGDPYNVRVKFGPDTCVERTPVVVLTNNSVPFMSDPAFADRIKQFEWKTAPMLKNIKYKPYPLCIFSLLNKYNIKYYLQLFYLCYSNIFNCMSTTQNTVVIISKLGLCINLVSECDVWCSR